jgi:hypothetical protein
VWETSTLNSEDIIRYFYYSPYQLFFDLETSLLAIYHTSIFAKSTHASILAAALLITLRFYSTMGSFIVVLFWFVFYSAENKTQDLMHAL